MLRRYRHLLNPMLSAFAADKDTRRPATFRSRSTLVTLEDRVTPANFSVTSLADNGPGTLRQAILDSNNAAGADSITFQGGLTGTITLTGGELLIADAVTIAGPGAKALTVSGGGVDRVFDISSGLTHAVNISGLTISGGKANSADGGGILSQNDDFVNLSGVVVSGNTASYGGGIYIGTNGFLQLVDSTLSGNTAGDDGGGIYFVDNGGLNVVGSTISGNTAGFAGGGVSLVSFSGGLLVRDSTIARNAATNAGGLGGGGIARLGSGGGTVTLRNTVVAQNPGGDISVNGNTGLSADDSFIGDQAGLAIAGANNNDPAVTDAMLGPLADNGGPTRTHAITTGSPLRDAGSGGLFPAGLATDQRGAGFVRVAGAAVDIGAFEFANAVPVITRPATATTAEDTPFAFTGGNAVSVRDPDPNDTQTATLTATNGTLAVTAAGGATITNSGTATVTGPAPPRKVGREVARLSGAAPCPDAAGPLRSSP